MDAIAYLASAALSALPALLVIARGYGVALVSAALLVVGVSLLRWMCAFVLAILGVTLVSTAAHAGTPSAATDPATLVQAGLSTEQKVQNEGDRGQPGSAIYSPFAADPAAQIQRTAVAVKDASAADPALTMTLTATAAGVVALLWLLQSS